MSAGSPATVLVVDDEPDVCALFKAFLGGSYTVSTATSGKEALDIVSADSIDAGLFDRRMPTMSGDELLGEIRDRGFDFPVALVTAVEPDFDIVSMGFDAYLLKPVDQEELTAVVDSLARLGSYERSIRDYFEIVSKLAALESVHPPAVLHGHEEYAALKQRFAEVKETSREQILELMDEQEFEPLLRRLGDS